MANVTFIVGPTATGKSEAAYLLAKEINAEIISCDSMLVYREPQIITSKPSYEMLNAVKHHFTGIISVENTYSVFDYYVDATNAIKSLCHKRKPVIVCGGSGLYVKALLDGIFKGAGKDEDLRKNLEERAQMYGIEYLYAELEKVDLPAARRIHPSDLKRIVRALEVYYLTGIPISAKQAYSLGLYGNLPVNIFGFNMERKELYRRIESRVDRMFEEGAVEEVEGLRGFNLSLTARKIIGVEEIGEFLDGKVSRETARDNMKKNTRHFAKRQITWFKKETRIQWFKTESLTPENTKKEILRRIEAD